MFVMNDLTVRMQRRITYSAVTKSFEHVSDYTTGPIMSKAGGATCYMLLRTEVENNCVRLFFNHRRIGESFPTLDRTAVPVDSICFTSYDSTGQFN